MEQPSNSPDLAPSYLHLFELPNRHMADKDCSRLRREASRPDLTALWVYNFMRHDASVDATAIQCLRDSGDYEEV